MDGVEMGESGLSGETTVTAGEATVAVSVTGTVGVGCCAQASIATSVSRTVAKSARRVLIMRLFYTIRPVLHGWRQNNGGTVGEAVGGQ